ncbi:MAG: uroporphyrinogen decarboxylase family protein, partial [bacterium]
MGIAISTTESSIRSNALRAFARQPVTHTPAGICLGGSWPLHQEHLSLQDVTGNDKETARIFADVHERLDADIIIPGAGATAFIARALGSDVRFDAKGAPQIIHGALEDRPDPDTLDSQQIWRDPAVQYIFESVSTLAQLNAGKRLILASGRSAFTIAGQLLGLE